LKKEKKKKKKLSGTSASFRVQRRGKAGPFPGGWIAWGKKTADEGKETGTRRNETTLTIEKKDGN